MYMQLICVYFFVLSLNTSYEKQMTKLKHLTVKGIEFLQQTQIFYTLYPCNLMV